MLPTQVPSSFSGTRMMVSSSFFVAKNLCVDMLNNGVRSVLPDLVTSVHSWPNRQHWLKTPWFHLLHYKLLLPFLFLLLLLEILHFFNVGYPVCPTNCNNQGKCVNGTCHCGGTFYGSDCSLSGMNLSLDHSFMVPTT